MISWSSRWSYICMHKVGIQKSKNAGWRTARNYLLNACPFLENLFFIDRNRLDKMFHSVQYNLFIRMEKMSRFQAFTPCKPAEQHLLLNDETEGFIMILWVIIINQTFNCGHLIWALHQRMKRGFLPNVSLSYTCMLLSSMIARGAD